MDIEFGPLIKEGHVVVYLDDILIYATTITELLYWMHKVFQLLLKLDLYLCPAKCSFNQTLVEYLGLIISEGKFKGEGVGKLSIFKAHFEVMELGMDNSNLVIVIVESHHVGMKAPLRDVGEGAKEGME